MKIDLKQRSRIYINCSPLVERVLAQGRIGLFDSFSFVFLASDP